jgi:hypothetical protein
MPRAQNEFHKAVFLVVISRPQLRVPNLKFAILGSTLRANFGFDQDTTKLMILVSFMDQKFARWTRGDDGANF